MYIDHSVDLLPAPVIDVVYPPHGGSQQHGLCLPDKHSRACTGLSTPRSCLIIMLHSQSIIYDVMGAHIGRLIDPLFCDGVITVNNPTDG